MARSAPALLSPSPRRGRRRRAARARDAGERLDLALGGGARLQFADETNIRLSLRRHLEQFESWGALIGEHVDFVPDIAFHQVGYLFLLDTPEQVATFREALAVQHATACPRAS